MLCIHVNTTYLILPRLLLLHLDAFEFVRVTTANKSHIRVVHVQVDAPSEISQGEQTDLCIVTKLVNIAVENNKIKECQIKSVFSGPRFAEHPLTT